jgi:hypothetical protein
MEASDPNYIIGTEAVFPVNVIDTIAIVASSVLPLADVVRRPLRGTDLDQSLGVFAARWVPLGDGMEMGRPYLGSSVEIYTVVIQAMVKDAEEAVGGARHSVLSELVRTMLYTDQTLKLGLDSLQTELAGVRKNTRTWKISSQEYFNNSVNGFFVYLSSLEMTVEVENRPAQNP